MYFTQTLQIKKLFFYFPLSNTSQIRGGKYGRRVNSEVNTSVFSTLLYGQDSNQYACLSVS